MKLKFLILGQKVVSLSMVKRFFLSLLILFIAFTSKASIDPYAKQCIVQINGNIEDLTHDFSKEVTSSRVLSSTMNVHLLYLNVYYTDFKSQLVANSKVLSFQKNGATQRRFVPNDVLYPGQSQMNKMGMEAAWNGINTGLTGNNDTIVIAVIDDGVDITNPDLAQNIFINYNEIPNDNIDNDGNGFVDDYWGWNARLHTDEIFDPIEKARHGSLVTGVIAASGNNGIGVSGVNLNVKYLSLVGGLSDADIIESYDYIMKMKKMYIETKGAKGAYIVASNSSFGRDGAKEDDAPLWCAMYDSMGKYGVINAGATSNSNVNVDLAGDLPSNCSSHFTIIVTDVNTKNQLSGYGDTGVDIGAYGSESLSTASWVDTTGIGWYDRFSGTSAATPYVAGAVGLIYSNACQSFLNLHDRSPDSAALLAKQFILSSVKKQVFLSGKSTSEGTLDVNAMLIKMDEWCLKNLTHIDPKELNEVRVFPNPVNDVLTFRFNNNISFSVEILNSIGQRVFSQNQIEKEFTYATNKWSKGLYYVQIRNAEGGLISSKKIIKN